MARHSRGASPSSRSPYLLALSRRRPRFTLLCAFVLIFILFSFMLGFEALMLPKASSLLSGLPAVDAAPIPVTTTSSSSSSQRAPAGTMGSAVHSAAEALAAMASGRVAPFSSSVAPPNISVVMPCYGQSQFLEEGMRSVLSQQYPPAELLIIDDGSEDHCGQTATKLLDGTLAPLRRKGVRTLQAWWGWSASDLRRFKDEVVLTPNRGVAHARNTGIRRARGDWICCIDADDTISDTYFLQAMAHVAAVSSTNLVYANQQFFGESRWQWHVPELRADSALVNGPLPLMTLFRKSLWQATPHGFDEALPKGHEDWALWLQFMRLALHPFKIEAFVVQYRYKKNSKMRNRERQNPEVPRLLRCLFPDLYPVRKLLVDHAELLKPNGFSEAVRMDVSVSMHLHPHRAATHLWRGMILQAKGDLAAAVTAYNVSKRRAEPYDWQGAYRLWRVLSNMGARDAAEVERRHLLTIWGEAQLAFYGTDVQGTPVEFRTAAPNADMTVGVIGG